MVFPTIQSAQDWQILFGYLFSLCVYKSYFLFYLTWSNKYYNKNIVRMEQNNVQTMHCPTCQVHGITGISPTSPSLTPSPLPLSPWQPPPLLLQRVWGMHTPHFCAHHLCFPNPFTAKWGVEKGVQKQCLHAPPFHVEVHATPTSVCKHGM
jgi:hypothetical protein